MTVEAVLDKGGPLQYAHTDTFGLRRNVGVT